MVIPVRPFAAREEAVEAALDVLLAARDEAEGQARVRYETAAAADGDVVRLWFGRLEPATAEPPWRDVVPELDVVPLTALLDDGASTLTTPAIVTDDRDPYAGVMAGVETDAAGSVGDARRAADARLSGGRLPRRVGHRPRPPRPAQGAPARSAPARVVSQVATV